MESPNEYLKKSEAYVRRLEDDLDFVKWVKYMRKKYSIDLERISYPTYKCVEENNCDNNKCSYCKLTNNEKFMKEIEIYVEEKRSLRSFWSYIFVQYLILDQWVLNSNVSEIDITDQLDRLLEDNDKDKTGNMASVRWMEFGELLIRPLAIRFSPYTTQTDLIDYIKKHFKKNIRPLQLRWKNDIILGKARKKS